MHKSIYISVYVYIEKLTASWAGKFQTGTGRGERVKQGRELLQLGCMLVLSGLPLTIITIIIVGS